MPLGTPTPTSRAYSQAHPAQPTLAPPATSRAYSQAYSASQQTTSGPRPTYPNSQPPNFQPWVVNNSPMNPMYQPLDPYVMGQGAQADALFTETNQQSNFLGDQFNRYVTPNYQLDQSNLQGSYDQNMAQLAAQQARARLDAQNNNANFGFAGQQYNNQLASLAAQQQFNARDRSLTTANAGNLSAQALTQFGIGSDRNNQAFAQQNRSDRSSATSRGAIGTLGYSQDVKQAKSNRDIVQRDTQLGYDTSRMSIDNGLQQALLGLDRNDSSINSQRSSADLSYQKARSDNDLAKQLNDQMASEYGVSAEQLSSAFERGMDKLGLDYHQAQDKLAEAYRSNDAPAIATFMQLMQQALQYAG